jgi:EAL domain-containing protein (putative c-di-GMP-specific phosphodiesterase class I)
MKQADSSGFGVPVSSSRQREWEALPEPAQARELRAAIERGELTLHYQPVVRLSDDAVIGLEALVRWRHPRRGLLPPDAFIPLAERTGLIVPLGRWTLREACRQLQIWRTAVPGADRLWVSVNISSVQLRDAVLLDDVRGAVDAAQLDPSALVLELTERLAIEDTRSVSGLLQRLRGTGVRISLDDFGTGYSSLGYLHQLPVDTIKLDRTFVQGLESGHGSAAIVSTIARMTEELGLQLIAEGVESEAQLALLRSLKCGAVQGHLLARPLDAIASAAFLGGGWQPRRRRVRLTTAGHDEALLPARQRIPAVGWVSTAMTLVLVWGAVAAAARRPAGSGEPPPAATAAPAASVVAAIPPRVRPAPAAPPPVAPITIEPPRPVSIAVEHDHVFGGCRGRLFASPAGLRFVPAENDKDAFILGRGTFLTAVDANMLLVRTAGRSYRFKATGPGVRALREFVAAVERLR